MNSNRSVKFQETATWKCWTWTYAVWKLSRVSGCMKLSTWATFTIGTIPEREKKKGLIKNKKRWYGGINVFFLAHWGQVLNVSIDLNKKWMVLYRQALKNNIHHQNRFENCIIIYPLLSNLLRLNWTSKILCAQVLVLYWIRFETCLLLGRKKMVH